MNSVILPTDVAQGLRIRLNHVGPTNTSDAPIPNPQIHPKDGEFVNASDSYQKLINDHSITIRVLYIRKTKTLNGSTNIHGPNKSPKKIQNLDKIIKMIITPFFLEQQP